MLDDNMTTHPKPRNLKKLALIFQKFDFAKKSEEDDVRNI